MTESETLRYTSAISERIIVLGCTGRFGGNEMLNPGLMDIVPLGRFELRTTTPLVARIKTPPNPTGEASNPSERRQLQQQLACLYGLLVDVGHVNPLSRSTNHLVTLLTADEGYLMTITLADDVMNRVYGSARSKTESIITAMGCGLRCNVLDVPGVREKMREGGYRLDLPDVSPGGESRFILEDVLECERRKDDAHPCSSRMGSSGTARQCRWSDRHARTRPLKRRRRGTVPGRGRAAASRRPLLVQAEA